MSNKPLTTSVLAAAFQRLTCSSDFVRRIKWWLTFAHSAERWLQFEYAHSLQLECDEKYPNQYAVACEQHKYADIVLYKHPLGKDRPVTEQEQIVAKLEIKFSGNWYTIGNTFRDIGDDVNRVDRYEVPSVALVFWVFAEPTLDHPKFGWINNNVNSRRTKPTKQMVCEELKTLKFKQILPDSELDDDPKRDNDFEMLDFFLYEYRNQLA
jgi:ssDNA-binding Zn-finger/Zn-ribbon topoisomerase 1